MSETYYIACMDCRECVWIGQRNWIYKQQRFIDVVEKFLFAHVEHEMQFLGLNGLERYTDWTEVVVPEESGGYHEEERGDHAIKFDDWLTAKRAKGCNV